MSFELVVLGSNGTFPTPDGASTGFLVKAGDTNVWVDAGTGTFANLQRYVDWADVDALVISHLHVDHFLDIYPFYYAHRYSLASRGPRNIPVYAPKGAEAFITQLLGNNAAEHCDFAGHLIFNEISSQGSIEIGEVSFSFTEALHPVESLAMRITNGDKSVFYTSDTGYTEDLIEPAKNADVMIAEASLQDPTAHLADIHMTADEAGILAAKAEVGRLFLTHLVPGLDTDITVQMAAKQFTGEVAIAAERTVIEV